MRVKMLKSVKPDFYCDPPDIVGELPRLELKHDHIYTATSNRLGAITAIDECGREIGVKPDEFELIFYGHEWVDFVNTINHRDIDIGLAVTGKHRVL